ncbi:MAG: major capsid protein [Microviridae sp.]|nr:MAG: major capsid protein [Microviridae sp.]
MKLFNEVQFFKPKKNKFDLSHEKKMTLKMGTITPILIQEVIPGDQFRINTEMLMRMQPMLAPIMHRVRIKTDYFFVPNRLVWDNWQKFITGGEDGLSNNVAPFISLNETTKGYFPKGGLADFFEVPPISDVAAVTADQKISALPFRAYQLIYNEFYRDQNLITEIPINKGDGAELYADYPALLSLRKRAWEKDYFTSALPFAQKGGPVSLPIDPQVNYKPISDVKLQNGTTPTDGDLLSVTGGVSVDALGARIENIESITNATTTINDLRVAVRLQEWLEKNARAGSRYIESILAHFGVRSSDARLQRPEYLGGASNPMVISEVLSTYAQEDGSGLPQGNMTGHGISAGNVPGFKRNFEEHGFIIGLMTILPKTAYQQGLPKQLLKFDKLEYAWPLFAQLGEQEVKQMEIYFDAGAANAVNEGTFGYQSRLAEYKFRTGTVHGDFRDSLAFWHMGRIFASNPALNESFINADPTKRIFAVEDPAEDEILCQLYNSVSAMRPLPYFNNPTL